MPGSRRFTERDTDLVPCAAASQSPKHGEATLANLWRYWNRLKKATSIAQMLALGRMEYVNTTSKQVRLVVGCQVLLR